MPRRNRMTQGRRVKANRGRNRKRLNIARFPPKGGWEATPGYQGPGKKRGQKRGGGRGNQDWATEPIPSAKRARKIAGANARTEYGPVERAMQGDIRGSRFREKQLGQQFNQLGTNINEAAAQTDSSYQQANAAVMANIEAAQKAAQANQSQIAGGNTDFAALTGADPSAFAQGTQEAANAAAQRSLTQTMASAPIAAAGANQAGYLRNVGLNARREGIHQRGLESKRRRKIKQDLLAARRERGQKAAANFMDIRDREHDKLVQRQAFKLDKAGLQQDAAQNAFGNSLDLREQRERERANRADEADARADNQAARRKERRERNEDRREDRRDYRTEIREAAALLRRAEEGDYSNPRSAIDYLIDKGVSPRAAKAAVRRAKRQRKKQQESIVGTVIPGEKITE